MRWITTENIAVCAAMTLTFVFAEDAWKLLGLVFIMLTPKYTTTEIKRMDYDDKSSTNNGSVSVPSRRDIGSGRN